MKKIIIVFISMYINGCAYFEQGISKLPIALGLLRSPITYKTNIGNNGPLSECEKIFLEKKLRNELIKQPNYSEYDCNKKHQYPKLSNKILEPNAFDDLNDLVKKETLVFVAISGGGARATVLGESVMALLESKFNEFNEEFCQERYQEGSNKKCALLNNHNTLLDKIDAVSTVSGGSIYAYRLARFQLDIKILDDLRAVLDENPKEKDYKSLIEQKATEWHADTDEFYDLANEIRKSKIKKNKDIFIDKKNIFNTITDFESYDLSKLGYDSYKFYIHLNNLFLGPALTTLTNESYSTILAGTLHGTTTKEARAKNIEQHKWYNRPWWVLENLKDYYNDVLDPSYIKLSNLERTPRYFFNATALETGLPFVFSQRLLQLPLHKPIESKTVRLDLIATKNNENNSANEKRDRVQRPLGEFSTLEDINSSPRDTSLAFSAMASASFPLGLEPIVLSKYGYDPVKQTIYKSSEKLHVSDGGLYDNSGLSTLTELIRTIKTRDPSPKNIIVLSINADADEYDSFYASKINENEGFFDSVPIDIGAPIRYKALGVDSLNLIHYVNKRRAEQLAIENIKKILNNGDDDDDKKINFLYFPVNFAQFSPLDSYRIPDPNDLYKRLKKIPTNFVISNEDKLLIHQAAEQILSWPHEVTNEEDRKHYWEGKIKSILKNQNKQPNPFCRYFYATNNSVRLDDVFINAIQCLSSFKTQ